MVCQIEHRKPSIVVDAGCVLALAEQPKLAGVTDFQRENDRACSDDIHVCLGHRDKTKAESYVKPWLVVGAADTRWKPADAMSKMISGSNPIDASMVMLKRTESRM